jgi:transposase
MSNQRYTKEFKIEAVKQVTERGHRVAEVAQRLGVSQHSLYQWIKARQQPAGVVQAQASQSEELLRLKAELKRVTEERDILKKAALDSTRRCNSSLKSTGRRFIVQRFSRPRVQTHRNLV